MAESPIRFSLFQNVEYSIFLKPIVGKSALVI